MIKRLVVAATGVVCLASLSFANLVSNPGFEEPISPNNWTEWGSISVETWFDPPEGSHAVYALGGWADNHVCGEGICQYTAPSTIQQGMEYLLTASIFRDDGWSATKQFLELDFFSSANQLLASYTNPLCSLPRDTWVLRGISATAPANSSYAMVTFDVTGAGTCGSLGADDFNLTAVPEPAGVFAFCALGIGCIATRRMIRNWRPYPVEPSSRPRIRIRLLRRGLRRMTPVELYRIV